MDPDRQSRSELWCVLIGWAMIIAGLWVVVAIGAVLFSLGKRFLFLLLLLPSLCWSQPIQHWAAAWQKPAALDIQGIPTNQFGFTAYWWHAGDLPNGVTVSNQWHDRVQNLGMTANTGAPTNGPCGVFFNGTTDSLAMGSPTVPLISSMLIILKRESGGDAAYHLWWDSNPVNKDVNGWRLNSRSAWNQAANVDAQVDLKATVPADTYIDLLIASTNSSTARAFTNGVTTGIQADTATTPNMIPAQLGAAFNGSVVDNHFQGCIQDIIIWTNFKGGFSHNFSSTDVSNTHYYAQQMYGVTP
jgi:hypothetical protein